MVDGVLLKRKWPEAPYLHRQLQGIAERDTQDLLLQLLQLKRFAA